MTDVVRYTIQGKQEDLVNVTHTAIEQLESEGYIITEIDNKYLEEDPDYKDIHLGVMTSDGLEFEVQVHSEESLATKEESHKIYEVSRAVETSEENRVKYVNQMRAIARKLKNPDNCESLKNFKMSKEGKEIVRQKGKIRNGCG